MSTFQKTIFAASAALLAATTPSFAQTTPDTKSAETPSAGLVIKKTVSKECHNVNEVVGKSLFGKPIIVYKLACTATTSYSGDKAFSALMTKALIAGEQRNNDSGTLTFSAGCVDQETAKIVADTACTVSKTRSLPPIKTVSVSTPAIKSLFADGSIGCSETATANEPKCKTYGGNNAAPALAK